MKEIETFGLPYPKTTKQEILLTLLKQKHVSLFDFPYLSGFRTRVSELSGELAFNTQKRTINNKFGNPFTYAIHFLASGQDEKIKEIYLRNFKEGNAAQIVDSYK